MMVFRSMLGAAAMALLLATPALTIAQEQQTIWDGVFTAEQAARGQKVNSGVCSKCHGIRGDGANEPDQPGGPAIARFGFLAKWAGTPVSGLFEYVRTAMPPDNPGSRTDQEYIDVIAHMFEMSGAPAGDTELPPDTEVLDGILIEQKPE